MHSIGALKKALTIVLMCFIGLHLHGQNSTVEQWYQVISKLRNDVNHNFLKTLRPVTADFELLFLNKDYADKAMTYANTKWDGIDKVPDHSMKPPHDTDKVRLLKATKQDLLASITHGLPEDYSTLGKYLKDDVVVYGLQYVDDNGEEQKTRAAFFYVNDRWIIIPQTFKAFP